MGQPAGPRRLLLALAAAAAAYAASSKGAATATKATPDADEDTLDTEHSCVSVNGVIKCGGDDATEWIVQHYTSVQRPRRAPSHAQVRQPPQR